MATNDGEANRTNQEQNHRVAVLTLDPVDLHRFSN